MSDTTPTASPSTPTCPDGYTQWSFWILAATILLLGVTVLVQALTGHTVAVQVIVGLALVAALLTFLPRVTDVERFVMNRSGGSWHSPLFVTVDVLPCAPQRSRHCSTEARRWHGATARGTARAKFAVDSLLEGSGFERSVPGDKPWVPSWKMVRALQVPAGQAIPHYDPAGMLGSALS
jgi:hypothetical protein